MILINKCRKYISRRDCESPKCFQFLLWLLNEHLKFGMSCANVFHFRNHCLYVTSLGLSTSTLQMPLTLVMEITYIQYCWADIVQSTKINILDTQKLSKYCLSDVHLNGLFVFFVGSC